MAVLILMHYLNGETTHLPALNTKKALPPGHGYHEQQKHGQQELARRQRWQYL